jgi:hypothetical protein
MTTEQHAWYSSRELTSAARRTPPVCGCGQDLDLCTRNHCPRCGVSLTSRAA